MDPNMPATRPTAGLNLRALLIEASCDRVADADDVDGVDDEGDPLDTLGALEANERVATVAAVRQRDRNVARAASIETLLRLARSHD